MTKIKFYDSDVEYPIESVEKNAHVITIIGDGIPENTSGFNILKDKGLYKTVKYPNFTTVYRVLEDGIQFSNDGSKYEPEPVPPIIEEPIDELV